MRGGRGSLLVYESTAADRAAADMQRVGTHMERLQQLDSCWSLSHAMRKKPARSFPLLAGRGGSVSRRDLTQAYRRHAQRTGGTKPKEKYPVKRQPLFGREGSGGRGASLREAASPPSFVLLTSLGEGARGRGLLFREAPSLAYTYRFTSFRTSFRLGEPRRRGGHLG